MRLAVLILTKNEVRHISRALTSVKDFATKVVVVDSYSTDGTQEVARALGAVVYERAWKNYSDQYQWGQEQIEPSFDWIMRLDADEVVESTLSQRICSDLPQVPDDVVAITVDRKHIFMNRWIKHGGRYPLTLTRIYRYGKGRIEQRWMDEHIIVDDGRIMHFGGGLADHNLNDITYFTDKHNRYATREAVDVLMQRHDLVSPERLTSDNTSAQAYSKRTIKERIYNNIPFFIGPFAYFFYRFILQRGFLDGTPGIIYHVLQAFWYRFLVLSKIVEYDRELVLCKSRYDKICQLEKLTGLPIIDRNV